jgi:hypothetical protein
VHSIPTAFKNKGDFLCGQPYHIHIQIFIRADMMNAAKYYSYPDYLLILLSSESDPTGFSDSLICDLFPNKFTA